MRMAREILTGQGVIVKRPDAEELKAIRFDGAWSFEKLVAWAEKKLDQLEDLYETSTAVPAAPNRLKLDQLCQELVDEAMMCMPGSPT
jgi:hypothetical protein